MRGAKERIWLVGSMGAGKSVVGTALAKRLGWLLLDNDAELEQIAGDTARNLSMLGAEALHDKESDQLRSAVGQPTPYVAGVAASVADRPADLALLSTTGFVVYLRAAPETLAARVLRAESDTGRPWLDDDPLGWLVSRLEEREPAYIATADLVVDVDSGSPESISGEIVAAWREMQGVDRD